MIILCALGKHQYGDRSRGLGTEYAAFIPALKNLGHDVRHFDIWDRALYRDFAELNLNLLKTVQNLRPDVLLTVPMHYEIWLETLGAIRSSSRTITVCWTTDDSWKYHEFSRFIGKAYHFITTTYPEILKKYKEDGIHRVMLTQWAANSKFLKEPLKARQCQYPVTFVGAAHGDRKKRINLLKKAGIDVRCFGHGWPEGSVSGNDVPRISRDSVISLNFANARGINQIKARTFEVPGSGGFLLTENAANLEKFYMPDKEIDIFSSHADLIDKINFYLRHQEKRDEIALAGFIRTAKEHTYENRFSKILETVKSAKSKVLLDEASAARGVQLAGAVLDYRTNALLRMLRNFLLSVCVTIFGPLKGPRAARRMVFEISWRLWGQKTFKASGWPGRMFPEI